MTAPIDPADVAAVVARLTEFGAFVEAATVTALATDLDAWRLLGPHRDWWSEIAAIVGRSCVTLPDVAVAVREMAARKDAEIARLRAGASTVGALLAAAPEGMAVEFQGCAFWYQARAHLDFGMEWHEKRRWHDGDSRWLPWKREFPPVQPFARLVPADQADSDPHARGPIGGAP